MWWTSRWNAAKRLVTKRGLPEPPLLHRSLWGENEPSMCRSCFPVHTLPCARNTISLIFSNSAKLLFWALILARWQRLIFSQYSAIGSTPPPLPIHSLHTYNTRTGGKFKGRGVSGRQCAGIEGLSVHRLLQGAPCLLIRLFLAQWLSLVSESGTLCTVRPPLPPSKTGHIIFFPWYSLPGSPPGGQDVGSLFQIRRVHHPHHLCISPPLHTTGDLHLVW